jgi:crotonobetainyl-CoA:carnitine CoA-transferase CaiB-like acyl-CoA transferase
MRERPGGQWQRELEASGVPVGPINDLAQAFADPGTQERGIEVVTQHPRVGEWHMVGTPWKLDRQGFAVRRPPPVLGEHTAEVLRELEEAD